MARAKCLHLGENENGILNLHLQARSFVDSSAYQVKTACAHSADPRRPGLSSARLDHVTLRCKHPIDRRGALLHACGARRAFVATAYGDALVVVRSATVPQIDRDFGARAADLDDWLGFVVHSALQEVAACVQRCSSWARTVNLDAIDRHLLGDRSAGVALQHEARALRGEESREVHRKASHRRLQRTTSCVCAGGPLCWQQWKGL